MSHTKASPTVQVAMRTATRGSHHIALARLKGQNRSQAGRGDDREAAIADALHRAKVFYADVEVERSVLLAEAKNRQIDLIVVDDTLHLPRDGERR